MAQFAVVAVVNEVRLLNNWHLVLVAMPIVLQFRKPVKYLILGPPSHQEKRGGL